MKKYFYLKDHLGNIRVTVDENGNVKGYNDYYPFGLRMPGRSMNTALNYALYKYSSKELDEENGINWYYFGARYYDPEIGRWWSVDPMWEKYLGISPYVFTLNNPIKYYDPDGKQVRSDSPGLIYKEVYQRAAQLRLQNYGYAEPIADPKFQEAFVNVVNTYGPTSLDIASTLLLFTVPEAAPLATGSSILSFILTFSMENHKSDATVSLTTSLMGSVAKSPKLKIIISTLQVGYDFFLSGEDKNIKNNTNMFASDKTNVAHLSQQKLMKDLGWSTKPSPQEMWDSIKKDNNKNNKEDSNNID